MSNPGNECNLCGSKDHQLVYQKLSKNEAFQEDYFISEAKIQKPDKIFKCQNCGLVFAQLSQEGQKYIDQYSNMVDEEYLKEEAGRREASVRILKRIEAYKPKGKLLDIGCANGLFLDEARRRGWDVAGVEVSKWAASYARERLGLKVSIGSLHSACFPAESFDVVVMTDVIEHLIDPKGAFLEIARILKKDGIACISTPDIASTMSRLLGAKWWGINKYHLFYFSKETFQKMALACGFEIAKYNPHIRIFSIHYWIKRIKPYNHILGRMIDGICKITRCGSWRLGINFYDQIEVVVRKK